jgi:hypothetical protein
MRIFWASAENYLRNLAPAAQSVKAHRAAANWPATDPGDTTFSLICSAVRTPEGSGNPMSNVVAWVVEPFDLVEEISPAQSWYALSLRWIDREDHSML